MYTVEFNNSKVITDNYVEAWEIFRKADAMSCEVSITDNRNGEMFASNYCEEDPWLGSTF